MRYWQSDLEHNVIFLEWIIKTLALEEAAAFLHLHPVTVAERAKLGIIPGAKLGKRWVFIEEDLVGYLRSFYAPSPRALQGDQHEETVCHFTNARTHRSGGSRYATDMDAYSKALGLPINGKPGSTTTS